MSSWCCHVQKALFFSSPPWPLALPVFPSSSSTMVPEPCGKWTWYRRPTRGWALHRHSWAVLYKHLRISLSTTIYCTKNLGEDRDWTDLWVQTYFQQNNSRPLGSYMLPNNGFLARPTFSPVEQALGLIRKQLVALITFTPQLHPQTWLSTSVITIVHRATCCFLMQTINTLRASVFFLPLFLLKV